MAASVSVSQGSQTHQRGHAAAYAAQPVNRAFQIPHCDADRRIERV
jgi:hypothetical protein